MEYVHAVILCTLALLHIQVLAAIDVLNHPQKWYVNTTHVFILHSISMLYTSCLRYVR